MSRTGATMTLAQERPTAELTSTRFDVSVRFRRQPATRPTMPIPPHMAREAGSGTTAEPSNRSFPIRKIGGLSKLLPPKIVNDRLPPGRVRGHQEIH